VQRYGNFPIMQTICSIFVMKSSSSFLNCSQVSVN
jgi:hypothetical protein